MDKIEDSFALEVLGLELIVGKQSRIFQRKDKSRKKVFMVHYGKPPCVLFIIWEIVLEDGWIYHQTKRNAN